MRSCWNAFCPTTRGDRRWIAALTPGEPKPSSYSLQPITPSPVVASRNDNSASRHRRTEVRGLLFWTFRSWRFPCDFLDYAGARGCNPYLPSQAPIIPSHSAARPDQVRELKLKPIERL